MTNSADEALRHVIAARLTLSIAEDETIGSSIAERQLDATIAIGHGLLAVAYLLEVGITGAPGGEVPDEVVDVTLDRSVQT